LQRLRIDLSHPADLYAYQELQNGANIRAVFYAIGRVLSGPNAWSEDPNFDRTRVYSCLRNPPESIGVSVVPGRETFDSQPSHGHVKDSELLQVDLRLFVPLLGRIANDA
jgi:hypothetical protein